MRSSIQVHDSLFAFGSIKVDDSALIEAPVVDGISFSARSFDRLGSSLSIFGFAAADSISGVSVAAGLLGSNTLSASGYTSLGSGLSVMRGAEIGTTLPVMIPGKLLGEWSQIITGRVGLARVGWFSFRSISSFSFDGL